MSKSKSQKKLFKWPINFSMILKFLRKKKKKPKSKRQDRKMAALQLIGKQGEWKEGS